MKLYSSIPRYIFTTKHFFHDFYINSLCISIIEKSFTKAEIVYKKNNSYKFIPIDLPNSIQLFGSNQIWYILEKIQLYVKLYKIIYR